MEGIERLTLAVAAGLTVAGCTMIGSPELERPGPNPRADVVSAPEARRVAEPASRGGNMAQYEQSGRTYKVRDSSKDYDERGVASWYGEEFHGRPTSSGEPYDMHKLSAAHRTLPLPSWVRVTNLGNGRSVVLRVNDRGPFADTGRRIIDVSYAAAVELGMVGTGTASVRVQALEPWQYRPR